MEKSISKNLFWRLLERFGAQGVTLIVTIILARVLDPESYGVVAIITVITVILQVFIDSGFGTALIRKKDADDLDFSTIFYFNLLTCLILYVGLFFISPIIAQFYENEDLDLLIKVSGLILIVSGFKNIQVSYISRNMLFKKFFWATLFGTVVAGAVGIFMAYSGYGVWALIAQNLINHTIDTIILWIISGWKPKIMFSFSRLKFLFSFAWKMLLAALLDTIWNEMRQLIIGKKYSSEDLAYYNKGQEYPRYGVSAINTSIDSVMLPAMGNVQKNCDELKRLTRKAIKIGSFIMWPIMLGLAACAPALVSVLLTDKWLPAVPYLQIFCVVYALYPIHTANLNAIKAVGKSDYFLYMEIIKKVIALIVIVSTIWNGPLFLALGTIATSVISLIINGFPNKKLLNYRVKEQLFDIIPYFILSVIMFCIVYSINYINVSNWIKLIIQVPLGISIYFFGARIMHFEPYFYFKNMLLKFFKKKRLDSNSSTNKGGE
ncbi:MAG: lipopolysaccharide biosynthesis protein [Clostridia bacterium]|nr:lipopolysaccharide biosynthesis protein [Clostridia bacterium]